MAQTWPVSGRRRAALHAIDAIGRTLFRARPRGGMGVGVPGSILIIEPWHIGDVVLAMPILACLRRIFRHSRISLLAKPFAREVLAQTSLVDEILAFDLPWTAQKNKYALGRLPSVARLIRDLRARKFDMTIDARMDIRSNLIAAATGAGRRVGYGVGGGGWLLTDFLPDLNYDSHRIADWLALLPLIGGDTSQCDRRPHLKISEGERQAALRRLPATGSGSPVVGYHPGASYPGKRWPLARFQTLASELHDACGGTHIAFVGPEEHEHANGWPSFVTVMRPSLRELMTSLACCDLLVCNDSGPMHLADGLGVPVVAIFEVGNPQWFGPSAPRAVIVAGERAGIGVSAAPISEPPRNPVAIDKVRDAALAVLRSAKR